jgi:hypothetical protein
MSNREDKEDKLSLAKKFVIKSSRENDLEKILSKIIDKNGGVQKISRMSCEFF